MFNKRNLTKKEIAAQHTALVEQLAKVGIKPEDVPAALRDLRCQIEAEALGTNKTIKELILAVS